MGVDEAAGRCRVGPVEDAPCRMSVAIGIENVGDVGAVYGVESVGDVERE